MSEVQEPLLEHPSEVHSEVLEFIRRAYIMIRWRVRQLMEERWWSVTDLAKAAGISYGTAFYLYRGKMKRIDLVTLDRLCAHFGVEPGDLLEYVYEAP